MTTPLERVRDRMRGAAQVQSHVVYVKDADLALLLALADAVAFQVRGYAIGEAPYVPAAIVAALAAITKENTA